MMGEAIRDHKCSGSIKRDLCPRCKNVHFGDNALCARCSGSLAHYLGTHLHKPPDWFVKKLSQLINAGSMLHWCSCYHTLREGESQLCDACKQQIDVDKARRWLQKVRRKRLNGMKSGSHVSDND